MGEGAGVRSSHCLDHKEKLGLVPSFATECWHSGLFQAVPFPGFLGQGVSPVGSSIPGRFVHPWRLRSLCTAAPGQAEELLVPSSSRGAGMHSSSSWIFLGSTSSPLDPSCHAGHTEHRHSLGQVVCFQSLQENQAPGALPGARERCVLWGRSMRGGKGCSGLEKGAWALLVPPSPPPPAHELAPGTVLTHSGHLQGYPSSVSPACLPAGSSPRGWGTRGLGQQGQNAACISLLPLPGSAWAGQNSTLDGKLLAQEWRVRSPEPQGPDTDG